MLDQIHNFIMGNLMGSAASIGIVLEMLLRLYPSQKPLSIAYGASAVIHKVADMLTMIGSFLDKILPQKLS